MITFLVVYAKWQEYWQFSASAAIALSFSRSFRSDVKKMTILIDMTMIRPKEITAKSTLIESSMTLSLS